MLIGPEAHGIPDGHVRLALGDGSLCTSARPPSCDDFLEYPVERHLNVPPRVVAARLAQVGDVADVIAGAGLFDVLVAHALAGELLDAVERLQMRARVRPAAPEVVDLAATGILDKRANEPGNVHR